MDLKIRFWNTDSLENLEDQMQKKMHLVVRLLKKLQVNQVSYLIFKYHPNRISGEEIIFNLEVKDITDLILLCKNLCQKYKKELRNIHIKINFDLSMNNDKIPAFLIINSQRYINSKGDIRLDLCKTVSYTGLYDYLINNDNKWFIDLICEFISENKRAYFDMPLRYVFINKSDKGFFDILDKDFIMYYNKYPEFFFDVNKISAKENEEYDFKGKFIDSKFLFRTLSSEDKVDMMLKFICENRGAEKLPGSLLLKSYEKGSLNQVSKDIEEKFIKASMNKLELQKIKDVFINTAEEIIKIE